MRKALLVVGILFAVCGATVAAEAEVPAGPEYTVFTKFFRGVGNIIQAPFEIPVSMFHVAAETDVTVGLTFGTLAGAVAGAERIVAGVIDIGTCPFPPYDRPLVTYEIGKSPVAQAARAAFPQEF